MLHCTNGDSVVAGLQAAGMPGRVLAVADVLHDGPCVAGLSREAWRRRRAAFLADGDEAQAAAVERSMAARDAALDEAAAAGDDIVLWFEHDLFDQLNLIWLLDALADRGVRREAVSLVVIDRHPKVPEFHGLGQLDPVDLAALFPARVPLAAEGVATARRAWAAVCGPTPEGVESEARRPSGALPFLAPALARLLEELPGTRDGLSRIERQGLTAVRDGAATLGQAFVANARKEEAVFLGDSSFYGAMRRLAEAGTPLVEIGRAGGPEHDRPVVVTDAGRAVLDGSADHAALNGIDRWVGGVHLVGRTPAWRWHAETSRLARAQSLEE